MSRSLRRLFPSVAIGPAGIASVLGLEWVPGAKLPCPRGKECNTPDDPLTTPTTQDPGGGWWAGPCPRCGWVGSVFELYCVAAGLTYPAAVQSLRRAGVRVPRGCGSPRVLSAFAQHVRVREGLAAIRSVYATRRLSGPIHGHALAALTLTKTPHLDPLWWCTTVSEFGPLVGSLLTPNTAADRRLGAATPDEAAAPTVVVPLYDRLYRLTGVAGYSPHPNSYLKPYVRVRPGDVALGFLHTAEQVVPRLGDAGLLTSCPSRALSLICSHLVSSSTPPPVVYVPNPERVSSVISALPKRPWVYVCDSVPAVSGKWISLIRRLGARVVVTRRPTIQDVAAEIDRSTTDWSGFMEIVFRTHVSMDATMSGVRARAFLAEAGWNAETVGEIRRAGWWSIHNLNEAAKIMTPRVPVRSVSAAPGLTVVESVAGWIWDETGEVLAPAYPADVRVERAGGLLRYRGIVVYRGRVYPFISRRFATDPVAVIAAVLLRAGEDPPAVHPRLAPHLAAVALHFGSTVT